MTLIAYHCDPAIKAAIIAQLERHRAADEIVKGRYWEGGKGCAVGCTLYSGHHAEYEPRFGVPQMLARLEDQIFEGLPNGLAKDWPVRFMAAIQPGADLSRVGWQFLHWLLTDEAVNPGINHPSVRDAVRRCADVLVPLTKGQPVDPNAACAAWSAAGSAGSAASAESAARSAEGAESAAWSAARSAESAASAAASAARSAAWSAAYVLMADRLVALIEAAPMHEA